MKKVAMTIRLEPGLHGQVTGLSEHQGQSINIIIGTALDLYLKYLEARRQFEAQWLEEVARAARELEEEAKKPDDTASFYGGGHG